LIHYLAFLLILEKSLLVVDSRNYGKTIFGDDALPAGLHFCTGCAV
jgi:hypothetical protein